MKQRSNRKQQILELATEAFSREGYDKVTVKQLADGCGITEPAIYRHYKSKDEIYIAVLESLCDRLDSSELFARLAQTNDPDTLLRGVSEHLLEFHTANQDMCRLLMYAVLRGHERARQIFGLIRGNYVDFLVKQLTRLHEMGAIVEKNNEITARCFVGMVLDCAMGLSLYKGLQGHTYEPNEIIANNVPIYVRGLSVTK
jgi:AcrR family transcriptional regulator